MKRLNPKLVTAIVALATLLVMIAWIAGVFETKIDSGRLTAETRQIPAERLHLVSESQVAVTETIPATITARDDTVVSSRILARIEQVHVRAGDTVKKTQVLINLEEATLSSRVNQARDQVTAVSAQLEEARLRLTRVRELMNRGLAAQADLDSAQASFDRLDAQLSNAREFLLEAEIVLGYSTIRAPINGRVIERLAEPGDTISPGTPLLSLYDPLSIRAEAPVRETLAVKLRIGQEITVEVGALGSSVMGTIEELVPAADAASRSFLVKVAIDFDAALMPGMFARFIVPVTHTSLILIPASVVTEVGELNLVSIYKNGQIERRLIRLGKSYADGQVAVRAGLNVGENLVLPLTASSTE
ncbi:MAG: efflux RND transporter periplasmic adaptor subunit [Pseudomonadales bacterium]